MYIACTRIIGGFFGSVYSLECMKNNLNSQKSSIYLTSIIIGVTIGSLSGPVLVPITLLNGTYHIYNILIDNN